MTETCYGPDQRLAFTHGKHAVTAHACHRYGGRMHGSASIAINASPDDVYAVLSDVTRMGDLSPECYKCEWNGGSAEAVTGATFTGHNRLGERE